MEHAIRACFFRHSPPTSVGLIELPHKRQFKDFDLLWEGFSTPILRAFPLKSGLKTPPTRETLTLFS